MSTIQQDLINKGLKEPFPAAPRRPSTHGFRFYRDNQLIAFHNFSAVYSAKRFLDEVIDGNPYKWSADDEIEVHGPINITIRAERLTDMEEALTHTDNHLEKQWSLPIPYSQFARAIRRATATHEPAKPEPAPAPKPAIERRPKPAPKRKQASDGVMTIGNIADELGISPRLARGILRDHMDKPADGWQWPADQTAPIVKLIKENLK